MFLSASEIIQEIEHGKLEITPFNPKLLKRASYVMRFSDAWREWNCLSQPVEVWAPNAAENHLGPILQLDSTVLTPGAFWLASTFEKITLPSDLVGIVAPLSHLARFGVTIHLGACFVAPMFGSECPTSLTLEVGSHNPSPIRIKAGVPACHLAFARTTPAAVESLGLSVYSGRESPSSPMLFEEFSQVLPVHDADLDLAPGRTGGTNA